MYLLIFSQNNQDTEVALFETIEEGRAFVSQIPSYYRTEEQVDEEVTFTYERFKPTSLPAYLEVASSGNILPMTRFMFRDDDEVEIYWKELPNLSMPNQGLADSATLVDAYVIPNDELKLYIEDRETNFMRTKHILEQRGYEVERAFRGSEDGEAIIYKFPHKEEWHFLMHMDPSFVASLSEATEEFEKRIGEYIVE